MTRSPYDDLVAAVGGLSSIAVGAVLVGVRGEIANANVALILMATVVVAATFGGRRAGLVAAVTATLSFDFFHTQPYLSLTIDSANDVETATVLLLTGLLVGGLAGRRRAAQAEAAVSHQEIRRLHRVADLIAHGAQPAEVLFACERELTALLTLEHCEFEAGAASDLPRLERNGIVTGGNLRFVHGDFALPGPAVDLPVLHRGQRVGGFVLRPDPDVGVSLEQRVVAVAIADQVGAALRPGQVVNGGPA
jgi:hypothetical protein